MKKIALILVCVVVIGVAAMLFLRIGNPPAMTSVRLGEFKNDKDPTGWESLGLTVDHDFPGEGRVAVNLPCIGERLSKTEWQRRVDALDAGFDSLAKRVVTIRAEVAPKVLRLQGKWFPDKKWSGTADELMRHMKLREINCQNNGEVSFWYTGDDLFNHKDLNVDLNRDLVVETVKFDG